MAAPFGSAEDIPENRAVFFVKVSRKRPLLSPLESCSLESIARVRPTDPLYLLTLPDFDVQSVEHLAPILQGRLRLLEWKAYIQAWRRRSTLPHMLRWYHSNRWRAGFVLNNLSNSMRLVLLYNHGGRYFDLDYVLLNDVEDLTNAVALEEKKRLNNAALFFHAQHPFVEAVTREFAESFDSQLWGNNGPSCLSRVYNRRCNWPADVPALKQRRVAAAPPTNATVSAAPPVNDSLCASFAVLPSASLYPLPWRNVSLLYRPDAYHLLDNELVRGMHMWSALISSGERPKLLTSDMLLSQIVTKGCPTTLSKYGLEGLLPVRHSFGAGQQPPESLQDVSGVPILLAGLLALFLLPLLIGRLLRRSQSRTPGRSG